MIAAVCLTVGLAGAGVAPAQAAPAAPAAVGDEVIAWVEVEDGAITGGPCFNCGDHGNFSGTGSYTFRETGMRSTMSVTAPAAGEYPIYIRYAAGPLSPEENVTRRMGLITNGGNRQQVDYPLTGDWETWRFVKATVMLNAGANTIALDCDRGAEICRLNFDAIQVGGDAPDPCAATPPDEGYRSMFDGTFESFDDWRKAGGTGGGFGRQTDCTILSVRGRGATWFTEQQAQPYTLKLDWRRAAANDESSVYVGSSSRGGADPVGGFKIPIGTDTAAIVPTRGTKQTADQAAVEAALRPVGEWNTYAIELTSSQVKVYLNGTLVNTYDSPDAIPASGFIGLENRGDGHDVSFKDIQIKPDVLPVGNDDAYRTDQDETLTVQAPGVLGNDTDAGGDPLTATNASEPANGEVTLDTDGSFTYTPDAGFFGKDSFTYTANDGEGDSAPATVTITVTEAEAPAATEIAWWAPSFTYGERGVVSVRVAPSTATGEVELSKGSRTLAVRTLTEAGKARILLPAKSLRPGRHRLTARYTGDASHAASSTTVRVLVSKVVPSMRVRAPEQVQRGKRATIRVVMSADNRVPVTGFVKVATNAGRAIFRKLQNGKVAVQLPKADGRAARTGRLRVKVIYLGSALAERVVDRATIRVTRRR
jgi:hypothetical protein